MYYSSKTILNLYALKQYSENDKNYKNLNL